MAKKKKTGTIHCDSSRPRGSYTAYCAIRTWHAPVDVHFGFTA
jgi:hypothetical protein